MARICVCRTLGVDDSSCNALQLDGTGCLKVGPLDPLSVDPLFSLFEMQELSFDSGIEHDGTGTYGELIFDFDLTNPSSCRDMTVMLMMQAFASVSADADTRRAMFEADLRLGGIFQDRLESGIYTGASPIPALGARTGNSAGGARQKLYTIPPGGTINAGIATRSTFVDAVNARVQGDAELWIVGILR